MSKHQTSERRRNSRMRWLTEQINPHLSRGYSPPHDSIVFKSISRLHGAMTATTKAKVSAMNYELIPPFDNIVIPMLDDDGSAILDARGEPMLEEAEIVYREGANTIFVDEILEQRGMTEEKLRSGAKSIIVHDGALHVERYNVTLLAYLRAVSFNADNLYRKKDRPALFYEYDPHKDVVARVEKRKSEVLMEARVGELIRERKTGLITALVSSILGKGVDYINRLYSKPAQELFLLNTARRRPDLVNKALNSKVDKNKLLIIEAMDAGLIVKEGRVFKISSSGKILADVIPGADDVQTILRGMSDDDMAWLHSTVGVAVDTEVKESTVLLSENEKLAKENAQMKKALEQANKALAERNKDMGAAVEVDATEIAKHIEKLVEDGKIEKNPNGGWLSADALPTHNADGKKKNAWRLDELVDYFSGNYPAYVVFKESFE